MHLILSVTVLAVFLAGPAAAGLPDPGECVFQDHLGRSPENLEVGDPIFQYTYRGVLRYQGHPVVGWPAADIQLEIHAPCPNPVIINPDGPSDAEGNVVWSADKLDQGGGSCTNPEAATVRLISIGLFKILRDVMSPDEDGNGAIALRDLVTFQMAFMNGGPRHEGDLDLSGGATDLADLVFFQRHFVAP